MSPARIKAFTRHFEHMFIQHLSAHPNSCYSVLLTPQGAYTIFSLTSNKKQQLSRCLNNIQKTVFFLVFSFLYSFSVIKLIQIFIFASKSRSPSSCPAYKKPVAHWGNWPKDFSCPSQILHARGNKTAICSEPFKDFITLTLHRHLSISFLLLSISSCCLSLYISSTMCLDMSH